MAADDTSMLSALRSVLDQADQLYMAVGTKGGPHLTPELFSLAGERIICLAAASAIKVKRARSNGIAAFAAFGADTWCSALAHVEVLDPLDPGTALANPALTAASPGAVADYVRGNARELSGAAWDFVRGRLGALPPHRVLVALTPMAGSVAGHDGQVRHRGWGSLEALADEDASRKTAEFQPAQEPPDLRELGPLAGLVVSGSAVLGWLRSDGAPLALPVQWDAERCRATLPSSVFDACGGAPTSTGCVTFDGWSGLGPSGKQGVMLRGQGSAERDGVSTLVTLAPDRVTTWDGVATQTRPLG